MDIKRCGFYNSYDGFDNSPVIGCSGDPYKCKYYHTPFKYYCPWKEVVDYERGKANQKQSISDYIITRCVRYLKKLGDI